MPQATTRRAKRAALSNPSPTTITFKSPGILKRIRNQIFCPSGEG
ncbi:hypothetical protein EC2871950_1399 [Escherichia coli 2871950]|nr:hypothetical protein EC2871950_1399 [Escherichia coli 2871950]